LIVQWHGHSCFEFFDSMRVVVDPHDGRSIGLKAPNLKADVVLITHDHFDHNAVRVVRGDFKVIRGPGHYKVGKVDIRGFEAYHDKKSGALRGKVTMYHLTMDGIAMLHVGDLGHVLSEATVNKIGKVDILFIPVGGRYTVDGDEAYENVKLIKPKVVVPMHYSLPGLSLSLQPVDNFLSHFEEGKIIHVGNSIEFTKNDLPEDTTVWVFSL